MGGDSYDVSELKIEVRPEPPQFGVWLSLLAVGFVLATIRPIFWVSALRVIVSAGAAAQLVTAAWALVNLVLLLQRRRVFIKSAIAYFVVNAVLLLLLSTVTVWPRLSLRLSLIGIAIGAAWVVYLLRSQHVREVFVR